MASTPLRPYDKREMNVGTRTGPPGEPAFAGDDFLAGKSYVTGCNGATKTNGPKPGYGGTPLGTFEEPDGTIKRYFAYGPETIIDSYCRNDGITESKYNALSDENKKNYCGEPIGGKYYLTDPNCGYVREVSRPVGVDIWYPLPDPDPDPDDPDPPPPPPPCKPQGTVLQAAVTVTGTDIGTAHGNGPYAENSDLAVAAVHAGLINVGDQAIIKTLSAGQDQILNFPGSTRNGVTTTPFSGTVEGIIETMRIVDPGEMASTSTSVEPSNTQGTGAEILVTLNSARNVIDYTVYSGGRNYKVGDTFTVISLGFGGGSFRPATLEVTGVRSSTSSGQCGINIDLVELLTENPPPCEVVRYKESITVDGQTNAITGPINGIRLLNPFADPDKITDSLSEKPDDFNWYLSCPPQTDLFPPDSVEYQNLYAFEHFEGPTYGNERPAEDFAFFNFNFSYYENQVDGCCPGPLSGGEITGLKIIDPGERNTNDPVVRPDSPNNGSGAQFNVSYDSEGTVTNIGIADGGLGYKVGDRFRIDSTYVFNYPSDALFEVTAVTPSLSCAGSNRINWKVNSVKLGDQAGSGGNNYGVGDRFRLVQANNSPGLDDGYEDLNIPAIVEVVNLEGEIVSGGTMDYLVEKDVTLLYNDDSKDRTINQVIDIDPESTTDEVLIASGNEALGLFMMEISRLPSIVEFQQYTRKIYATTGVVTDDILTEFRGQFSNEIQTVDQVTSVQSSCDRISIIEADPGDGASSGGGTTGSNCIWDRKTFYQGAGPSRATNIQLKQLYDFYGQPWGSSGPGEGSPVDEISCPRPGGGASQPSGLIDDSSEPDLSDFAGMKVWRWVQCGDGSNGNDADLGGYVEDTVPCPGLEEGCTNPEVSDSLAVYNQDSKITWNDGSSSSGDFVKTATDPIAKKINDKYLSLLGRPAKGNGDASGPNAVGLNYWYASATNTTSDQWAIYERGRVVYNDGTQLGRALVKETITQTAGIINGLYLSIVGRPAEQAGLDYWCRDAQSRGIDAVIADVTTGLNLENANLDGLDYYVVGVDAVLMDIEDAAGPELARGGVSSYKLYCETQVSGELDLSWFIDTRPPPWYGTVDLGVPVVTPLKVKDTAYLINDPDSQNDTFSLYATTDRSGGYKPQLDSQFVIGWPEVTGSPSPGQPDPVYVKYIKATYYSYDETDGVKELFNLQTYDNDLLQPLVGAKDTQFFGLPQLGAPPYTNPWGGYLNPTDSNFNNIETFITYMPNRVNGGTNSNEVTPIPKLDAEAIAYDETPNKGRKYWVKLEPAVYMIDPRSGGEVAGLYRGTSFESKENNSSGRFISQWTTFKTCSNGEVIPSNQTCPEDPGPVGPGPVGPGPVGPGTCSPSVVCQGNNQIDVAVNQPTTLTFTLRINGASGCSTQGTAKISIRRYWPCPVFGPASGAENRWIKQKVSVPVVNGEATYELPINTSRSDYLATSNEEQTVDDPGNCHWIYSAFWEYDHPLTDCKPCAWSNPGCNGEGAFNKLDEILCVQKQVCAERRSNDGGAAGKVKQLGKIKKLTMVNPYPDPSVIDRISVDWHTTVPSTGFPIPEGEIPGLGTPNTAGQGQWNWYWDCLPNEFNEDGSTDILDDIIPGEQFYIRSNGEGSGATVRHKKIYYINNTTLFAGSSSELKVNFPAGKGCVDSGGDRIGWYVYDMTITDQQGDNYAVGDIIELYAVSQDADTVLAKAMVSEIVPTKSIQDCSQAPWANEFESFEMDAYQDCLPYCSTAGNQTFYWNGESNRPKPGENCSSGAGGADSDSACADCSEDCPACEQEIKVVVADATECGPMRAPFQREGGAPGINSVAFTIGKSRIIDTPNFFPVNINKEDADVKTRQRDGLKYVKFEAFVWVYLPKYTLGTESTRGIDLAVDFSGDGDKSLVANGWECGTPGQPGYYSCEKDGLNFQESWINYDGQTISNGQVFDCDPWRNAPDPSCAPGGAAAADCDAKVRTVAKLWYQVEFEDDSLSQLLPIDAWEDWDTDNERTTNLVDFDYWQEAAGNEPNGLKLDYFGEAVPSDGAGDASFMLGEINTYLPYDKLWTGLTKEIKSVSIYAQIISSNDHFYVSGLGNDSAGSEYHPPPPGFDERDFGTDFDVTSSRPPWYIPNGGPGPKDDVFFCGKYSIGTAAKLPTAEWDLQISGCEDAQVHEPVPVYGGDVPEVVCGDPEGDNWYRAGWSFGPKEWRQEGEKNGEFFGEGYPQTSSCPRVTFDPKTGQGGGGYESGGAFCPWYYGFNDCIYKSDVKLSVNGPTSIDWGDYNVGGCTTGIKLVWYCNNIGSYPSEERFHVVSRGYVTGPTGDGGYYRVWNDASCGDVWIDLSSRMTDPEKTYTVRVYAVVNNVGLVAHKEVNRNWSVANGDEYNYTSFDDWAINRQDVNKFPIEFGSDAVIDDDAAWNEGDMFQVILASTQCFVKGNSASTGKDLTGLQDPQVTITSTVTNGSNTQAGGICDSSPCCDPDFASDYSRNCDEILETLRDICGERLCGNAGFTSGTLKANVANKETGWPRIPGTQQRVVGQIKYRWQKKGNNNVWTDIPDGTGDAITYGNDGSAYRVTVTFDLTGYVPAGYTAKPKTTSTTVVYNSDNEQTEVCPDGTIVPIGSPCPQDPGACEPPEYLNTSTSPFYIINQGSLPIQQITVNNNEPVKLGVLVPFEGFSSPGFAYVKAQATIFSGGVTPNNSPGSVNRTIDLTPTVDPNLKRSDIVYFFGDITETHSSTTKDYNIQFRIYYQCVGESETKFVAYGLFNTVKVTWGSTEQPYVYGGPECRYAPAYQNSQGCGSYVADWYDPQSKTVATYYMLKKDSVSIDDRGPKWSSAISDQNARCDFCPTTNCPSLKITGVTLSPQNPKVGDRITAQVNFNWDPKGFGVSNQSTLAQWTGDGVTCQPGQQICMVEGVQVQLGPYTSEGIKNLKATVFKYFDDPNLECPISSEFNIYGFIVDVFDFTINIGGTNEPPDDNVKPVISGRIANGNSDPVRPGVKQTFVLSYDLSDGKGYKPSDREVSMKWDGGTAQFNQTLYDRTFNSAGSYTVTCRVAKLYAKPGYDGPLDAKSILDAGEGFWAYDDASLNVNVEAEPSNDVAPSATASITGPNKGTLNNGTVTLDFSATASVGNTNYTPTLEPSRFTYGRNNAFRNNVTNVSWSETFTSAGTYNIPVTFRKNYCDPGVSFDSSTGSCDSGSKSSAVGRATKTVTIEAGGPTGTKPTATIRQKMSYSTEVNGCGYGVAGTGIAVTCTTTIDLTQGTGDYAWDTATTTTGNWVKNGNTLQQTITRMATSENNYSGNFGTQVIFKKNGQEVHRDGSGQASWCINIIRLNINPNIPGGPDVNIQ